MGIFSQESRSAKLLFNHSVEHADTDESFHLPKGTAMPTLYTVTSHTESHLYAADKPKQPEERPSHHQEPRRPGSDHDHTHDEERLKEEKRNWDEHHPHDLPPKKRK